MCWGEGDLKGHQQIVLTGGHGKPWKLAPHLLLWPVWFGEGGSVAWSIASPQFFL